MLATGILIFICVCITLCEYLLTKKIFTPTTMLAWPFIFVILLNNIIGIKLGFFKITDDTIYKIMFGILAFAIGNLIANYIKLKKKVARAIVIEYRIKQIAIYVSIVALITTIRLVVYINKCGLANFVASDGMNGILMRGVFCHFLLSVYPLIPILVSYSLKNRKKNYMIPAILILILVYFTFIKYHIIALVLITLIYLNIENPKRLKRTIPFLICIPIMIFFLNYLSNFRARGINAEEGYLIKHLINYLCGGVLYDSLNPTFTYNNFGIIEIIIMMMMAIPNLVLNLLFNTTWYQFQQIPFLFMGASGEYGNVVNTVSFFFTSKNTLGTIIVLIVIGFMIGIINVNNTKRYPFIAVVYTFVFLSFYATFLVLTPAWEMLLYSIIVPPLFIKRKRED